VTENCTITKCEHWESASPSLDGHCSHGSCPNYLHSCPVHENYGMAKPQEWAPTAREQVDRTMPR
jgi:hypothetical protein